MEGYSNPLYASSLAEFGTPFYLQRSRGWLLERGIPGTQLRDLMGCYPIFTCQDWRRLDLDIRRIGEGHVSLVLVTDPFAGLDEPTLREIFTDIVRPFKRHYIVDLEQDPGLAISKHHRYYLRRSQAAVRVEACTEPAARLDLWVALYQNVIDRYRLRGIQAFSRNAFARLMQMPGVDLLIAYRQGEAVGAHIWVRQCDRVYSHLNAVTQDGYQVGAAYALYGFAMEFYKGKARYLDLGGGAGLSEDGTDGLAAFKRGWANDTRPAYLCGKVFNRELYLELVRMKRTFQRGYFPAYRWGEFTSQPAKANQHG